jgi:hypothetical protein
MLSSSEILNWKAPTHPAILDGKEILMFRLPKLNFVSVEE